MSWYGSDGVRDGIVQDGLIGVVDSILLRRSIYGLCSGPLMGDNFCLVSFAQIGHVIQSRDVGIGRYPTYT